MKNLVLLLMPVLLFCGGCAQKKVEYTRKLGFGVKDKGNYPKIKNHKLSLELSPGTRQFKAGVPGELIFILHNKGDKALRIPEWHKFEANNLSVRCQIWLPGTERPDPSMWLNVSAPVKKPIWRYPLIIGAGDRVFISLQLDFLGNLIVNPGAERRYFIEGKLNLKSVDVAAPVVHISILPGAPPARQNNSRKSSRMHNK